MYEIFDADKITVSDEEMKEVMEKGKRVTVCDRQLEVVAYLYNNRVYIYDIKESNR